MSANSGDTTDQPLGLCDECGQGYIYQPVPRGAKAQCTRCGAVLYRNRNLSFDKSLAYTVAALILFVVVIDESPLWLFQRLIDSYTFILTIRG